MNMTINTKFNIGEKVFIIGTVNKFIKGDFIDVPCVLSGNIQKIYVSTDGNIPIISYSIKYNGTIATFNESHVFNYESDAKEYLKELLNEFF